MAKQPETRWTELALDLDLGRADDLAWAIGYSSWGDPDVFLATDLTASNDLNLPLDQTYSVVFVACLLRGWLPVTEQAAETIGEFLPKGIGNEARALQNLIARIESSSDPRLEPSPPITGSAWPRLDVRQAVGWALDATSDDNLIAMPDTLRAVAQSAAGSKTRYSPPEVRPIAKEELPDFRAKSANALFTMFLALSYTSWGARHIEDSEDLLKHLKKLLETRPDNRHLEPFQLAVILEAQNMSNEQFANILANAEKLFSEKAKVTKRAKEISLGRAQTP